MAARLSQPLRTEAVAEVLPEEPIWFPNQTPSGILVEYCPDPRQYKVNGEKKPSVTEVLKVLHKELQHWGQETGVLGMFELWKRGLLTSEMNWNQEKPDLKPDSYEEIKALLKQEKLSVNDRSGDASDRGKAVHSALEAWCDGRVVPEWEGFPEAQQPYVRGLAEFLAHLSAADPEPILTEIMVGSIEHGFAGRFDLTVRTFKDAEMRLTPKQKWQTLEPGYYMVDLKTAKDVYPSTNFPQLAAYELAAVECGYPPTDAQYVLNIQPDGGYKLVRSKATFDDFLAVLRVYQSNQRLK